ncbi:DUF427 domain-containing protein [Kribbella qitaiheensis]|uniref:DUF427 domain-containing protein n=1 Tax=Kribbella qitaiheensis TaxID=1544730 RepID=UPI00360CC61B
MSTKMRDLWSEGLSLLRYEPTEMRIRVRHGGRVIADTTRAALVWEPLRVVPSYAVPLADLSVDLAHSSGEAVPAPDGILHPGIPFAAHSSDGHSMDLLVGDDRLAGAGFRPDDPELAEYVVLDFNAFDEWLEEDQPVLSHPREPYHRVDIRPSSRAVRIELDGVVLAESSRPTFVFETSLPTRFYLPREDIVAELEPSELRTTCAYKGRAIYYSAGGRKNLMWSYPDPLSDARDLAGLVAVYDDLVDVYVDGELRGRPSGPVAQALQQEFGLV